MRAIVLDKFRFDEVHEALRVMEANEAGGKMVAVH
jgi:hypothetical protein